MISIYNVQRYYKFQGPKIKMCEGRYFQHFKFQNQNQKNIQKFTHSMI